MNAKQIKLVHDMLEKEREQFNLKDVINGFISGKYNLFTQNLKLKKRPDEINLDNLYYYGGAKGYKRKFRRKNVTFVLYGLELLPYTLGGGKNLCEFATTCFKKCLVWTGINNMLRQGKMLKGEKLSSVMTARNRRTWLYNTDKVFFLEFMEHKIKELNLFHMNFGELAIIRLGVMSDEDFFPTIDRCRDVNFYDYTKDWSRKSTENYHLTYSYSEKVKEEQIISKLKQKQNVAVVFKNALPSTFIGYPVINGDISDFRFLDPKGVIVGLKEKHQIGAKEDTKFIINV